VTVDDDGNASSRFEALDVVRWLETSVDLSGPRHLMLSMPPFVMRWKTPDVRTPDDCWRFAYTCRA